MSKIKKIKIMIIEINNHFFSFIASPVSDVTQRYDVVFWLGDLNFRLMGNREEVIDLLNKNNTFEAFEYLLLCDQLNDAKKNSKSLNYYMYINAYYLYI